MTQYAVRNIATQIIESAVGRRDPEGFEGPIDEPPIPAPGTELIPYQGFIPLTGPTNTAVLRWEGAAPAWVEVATLDELKARKAAAISAACGEAITAGFACGALGAGFRYPAKFTDQANLTGSVMRSFYPNVDADWRTPFWCADAESVWEWRPHSAVQIQQVGDCAVVARLSCMSTNEQLQAQIIAAESPEALAAINWPDPIAS